MNRNSDQDLLREYARSGSDAAFAELVRRHVNLVYSTARRMVGDSHLAEDVAQSVFLALAKQHRSVRKTAFLATWLHRTTHHLAANAVRSEARRRAREREAAVMNDLNSAPEEPGWEIVAPQLDVALLELNEADRDALLRRYFQRQPAREMARMLGISDEAAQKRVNRAVDRLREALKRRGIAVAGPALVALIATNGAQSAPLNLVATISAVALSGASAPVAHGFFGIKLLLMTTFQKTVVAAAVLVTAGLGIYEMRHLAAQRKAARDISAASAASVPEAPRAVPVATRAPASRPTPRDLPAPRRRVMPLKNSIAGVPFTATEMYALLKNKVTTLTPAQVESYLAANNRSAKSLLAAFRTTSDLGLLKEAAQKYPHDPQVAFEIAIRLDASPAERLAWLDVLRQTAPDNPLPDYLTAVAHFQAGDTGAFVQDLIAAAGKPGWADFSRERIQANEEAYLAAGYPPGEAKMIASICLAEPHLLQIKELGQDLLGLADAYRQANDANSRESALQLAVDLGQRLSDPSAGETLLRQTVGVSIERAALQAMDPASSYDATGLTVQGRLDALTRRIDQIRLLAQQADPLWKTLGDQDWVDYGNQLAASGEEAAIQWLLGNRAR